MNATEHRGSCLCGYCSFIASGKPEHVFVCSCIDCQQRTGSAFGVGVWFLAEQVTLPTEEFLKYRHINDKGRWVEHGFCPKCGSVFTWQAESFSGKIAFAGGCFRSPHFGNPVDLFVHKKTLPKWIRFLTDTTHSATETGGPFV